MVYLLNREKYAGLRENQQENLKHVWQNHAKSMSFCRLKSQQTIKLPPLPLSKRLLRHNFLLLLFDGLLLGIQENTHASEKVHAI